MVCRQTETGKETTTPEEGSRGGDLSAKTFNMKTKKKKKNGAFDDVRQAKDDLNFDWRAICDRRLSCPTLLSPVILFHFRKSVEVPKICSSTHKHTHTYTLTLTLSHTYIRLLDTVGVRSCVDFFGGHHRNSSFILNITSDLILKEVKDKSNLAL